MKNILFLLLTLTTSAFAQDCYPFKTGELCIPQIGRRTQITFSKGDVPLPATVLKLFNNTANYSGPNCYNTAFMASGVIPATAVRYYSPEEFEYQLKKYYEEVSELKAGDLIVYEANRERGHVAYYLGDNLVFHKKSYNKNYLYRIVPIENVGKLEKNEWTPSPWDDVRVEVDENLGKTTKAYYRLRKDPLKEVFTERDQKWLDLIAHIETQLQKDGPNWSVGKNMGFVTENLLGALQSKVVKEHPLVIAKFKSLNDQVFQSLEENYFSRARNSRDADNMKEEICYQENDFTKVLIQKTAVALDKDPVSNLQNILTEYKSIDRKKCSVNILSSLK